jgi:hypothetical protein
MSSMWSRISDRISFAPQATVGGAPVSARPPAEPRAGGSCLGQRGYGWVGAVPGKMRTRMPT